MHPLSQMVYTVVVLVALLQTDRTSCSPSSSLLQISPRSSTAMSCSSSRQGCNSNNNHSHNRSSRQAIHSLCHRMVFLLHRRLLRHPPWRPSHSLPHHRCPSLPLSITHRHYHHHHHHHRYPHLPPRQWRHLTLLQMEQAAHL